MFIRQATLADLENLLVLFNQYRKFYEQEPHAELSRTFLHDNLSQKKSIIFIALDDANKMLGFAQINPGTCSLALSHYWILYDLYIDSSHRREGLATALLEHVKKFATESGASRVDLQTAITNQSAQKLYEKNNYVRDAHFYTYSLDLVACVPDLSVDKAGGAAKRERLDLPVTSSHTLFASAVAQNPETVTSAHSSGASSYSQSNG